MPRSSPSRITHQRHERFARVFACFVTLGLPAAIAALLIISHIQHRALAALPPVPVPALNPITESKRVLGKMLFWDEQLSTANVVSCGTCHALDRGGAESRTAVHPGDDNLFNTADDTFGSPGIIRSDSANNFTADPLFALSPQVTDRYTPSIVNAAFAPRLFWDGRADGPFVDPQTLLVVIPSGAALEVQATRPPLNNTEMAHAAWDWPNLISKLQRVEPLALATDLPPDVQLARQASLSYPQLFQAAFGDSQITAPRIAMALATYLRTLISNQAPFDDFRAGNTNALTPQQRQGFIDFQANNCGVCHTASQDLFTDHSFRNIGLRPVSEDPGRQAITGAFSDRGRFKTPSLRNVTLKSRYMHTGQFNTLEQVMAFYARSPSAPPQQLDNLDGVMNLIIPLTQQESQNIIAFLHSLTDPRVASRTFPFDEPLLFTQRPADQNLNLGGGVPGSGALVPQIIVQSPAMLGNAEFRVGLTAALGNTAARLAVSRTPPQNGEIIVDWTLSELATSGTGAGMGVATQHWPLNLYEVQPGETLYVQWHVLDPAAPGGVAKSSVGQLTFFCGSLGCECDPIDFNRNDVYPEDQDVIDFFTVLSGGSCPVADISLPQCDIDFNNNGVYPEDQDVIDFFNVLSGGTC